MGGSAEEELKVAYEREKQKGMFVDFYIFFDNHALSLKLTTQ